MITNIMYEFGEDRLDVEIMAAGFDEGVRTSNKKAAILRAAAKMVGEPRPDRTAILFDLETFGVVEPGSISAHEVPRLVADALNEEARSQERIAQTSAGYRDKVLGVDS
jgi:hypothetical protein